MPRLETLYNVPGAEISGSNDYILFNNVGFEQVLPAGAFQPGGINCTWSWWTAKDEYYQPHQMLYNKRDPNSYATMDLGDTGDDSDYTIMFVPFTKQYFHKLTYYVVGGPAHNIKYGRDNIYDGGFVNWEINRTVTATEITNNNGVIETNITVQEPVSQFHTMHIVQWSYNAPNKGTLTISGVKLSPYVLLT